MQCLCLSVSLMQRLSPIGGGTESVFPKVEGLMQDAEYQQALEFVASRKSMSRYHSMVDFLFCEIFVQYRTDCFKFYDGRALRLIEMVNAGRVSQMQLTWFEQVLVHGLELAKKAFVEERDRPRYSWGVFRQEALTLKKN